MNAIPDKFAQWESIGSAGLRRSKLRLEERRRSVERRVRLIQHRRKALEHMRDAWGDLVCDRHLVDRCPAGKPKSVAEQDFVRTHLDQERW